MKLGKRDPKGAPALQLGDYLTGIVPAHPASEDYLARLSGWQMLGNDTYGDCVAVTWANTRRLVTATLSTETYPTLDEVIAVYKTQNPGFPSEDNGMDIQTLLEYLVKTGAAVGFAKVDHSRVAECEAAAAIFGSIWTGVQVQTHNRQQFANGDAWTYDPTDQVEGGHSVIVGGYSVPEEFEFITWAEEAGFAADFWSNLVDEAWVVIWPEMLGTVEFQAGIDLAQFAADYTALTGKEFPVSVNPTPPAPEPTPEPTPAPTPEPTPEPTPTPEPPAPTPEPTPEPPAPEPTPEPPAPVDPWAEFIQAVEAWVEGLFTRQAPHPREVALFEAITAFIESQGHSFEVRP